MVTLTPSANNRHTTMKQKLYDPDRATGTPGSRPDGQSGYGDQKQGPDIHCPERSAAMRRCCAQPIRKISISPGTTVWNRPCWTGCRYRTRRSKPWHPVSNRLHRCLIRSARSVVSNCVRQAFRSVKCVSRSASSGSFTKHVPTSPSMQRDCA